MTTHQKGFYYSRMGPRLRELVDQQRENQKLNDVSGELELMRVANARVVDVYEALIIQHDSPEAAAALGGGITPECIENGKRKLSDALQVASDTLRTAMKENVAMAEAAAKIHNLTVDRISPDMMDSIVRQICGFVHICFSDNWEAVERFDQMLTEKLQLPSVISSMGTKLTPANSVTPTQEVQAMINTIPEWKEPTQ